MAKGVRSKPERVAAKLREIEVNHSQGKDVMTDSVTPCSGTRRTRSFLYIPEWEDQYLHECPVRSDASDGSGSISATASFQNQTLPVR